MKWQSWKWGLICLLFVAGAWLLWHQKSGRDGSPSRPHPAIASSPAPTVPAASPHGVINTNATQISLADWNTNKFAGRLSNTPKPIGDLVNDNHAILLENALIDTQLPRNFVFPKNLQPQGDPGAYIVQARGPIDNAFRAMLAQAGATIVSYIPNDAYLVRATASVAGALGGNPRTQAVIPYEPYYKIQASLLYPAVQQLQQPDRAMLKLGLFADDTTATIQQIEQLGGQIVGRDRSPFGPVVRVIPPRNWTALATLSGVQIMEPYHPRAVANDLARATVGVAADSLTPNNYTNLTGKNIIVEVNDTGIDALHPDLAAGGNYGKAIGVIGDAPQSLVDTNGHGTHVAGIIAGNGMESTTVTNAPRSTLNGGKGTNYQFRGMAPGATLFSVGGIQGGADTNIISDMYFQEVPALTNALISNNSWVFEGDSAYDLSAASYDAAVRDALPFVTGSQPVLFVFAAGNAGNGNDSEDLGGGIADSIESPATGKNVITVGALQEARNITNSVTTVTANADGSLATNTSQPWLPETSTSYRVAGFSSRGNVGVGTEGAFGRYKPDVCAPGTFILSTRSEQWDINSYFYQNPTNHQLKVFSGFIVQPGKIVSRPFPFVPSNAVQLVIETFPNGNSPFSFAVLPTLIGLFTSPGYQYLTANDPVLIPPDPNAPTIPQILASGQGFTGAFNFALSNNTSSQVIFDLLTDIITTNGSGDYFLVLSNLDNSIGTPNGVSTGPGPFYRYETGTSMATPMVSGTLALMQEFYADTFFARPSPAMLKAMLINGAQATGLYTYQVQNTLNYEGWGLINLPNSLPPGIKNQLSTPCSTYVQDQNPDNALATGDSQTFHISVTSTNPQPLRVTLTWTDPPGDPAAAIKLVNNLVLVVTNFSNSTNPIVYYGNDIAASSTFNNARPTNTPTAFDSINNVQTVNLPLGAGTSFTVTVMGFRVNVNAVTAQSNNVVQDYALVVSCGNGQDPAAMTITPNSPVPVANLTGDQQIDFLSGTNVNAALVNQFVGANTPLLGNNTVPIGTITVLDTNGLPVPGFSFAPNAVVTVGMTNQWHFYVITNSFASTNAAFTNAAFVVFNPNAPDPDTLSIPRMGVFTPPVGNATRDADIDLYVSTSPGLTNLDPNVISSCVHGTQVGLSLGNPFNGASLGPGSSEFVVDIGSQGNEVYYVGVKSEDQMAAEYGFISIFSATPFSTMNNGNQEVHGVPLPVNIPDGSPTVPGKSFVFGLAIYPITVGTVTVSDSITHQNFGDLIGTLTLNGGHPDVLNNHDSFGSLPNTTPPNRYDLLYDDSAGGGVPDSRPSDGPGSLVGYFGEQGIGVWQLSEVDDSSSQIGTVIGYSLTIQPKQDLNGAIEAFSIPPGSWFYGFVDVPPGATNLTVTATNTPPVANPPLELFVKFGSEPTTNSFDQMTVINNPGPGGTLWGTVSVGPPLTSGRYFVGIFNPSSTTANGFVFATIGLPFVPAQKIYSSTDTPIPILDDAVTTDSINVPDSQTISSLDVAIAVQHPRISDLVFHLISPDGTRELLMENRGGTDPNGAGGVATVTTNTPLASSFEGVTGDFIAGQSVGGWTVVNNQVSVQTDAANAYQGTNLLALANGTLSVPLNTIPGATYTLTFACRGPGAVGWWRGESNAVDSINGNNGTLENVTFTNGEVGSAFAFATGTSRSSIPDQPLFYLTNSLSIEGWIYPSGGTTIFWRGDTRPGFDPYFLQLTGNELQFTIEDQVNNASVLTPPIAFNQWYHVAATLDGNTGTMSIYINGSPAAQINTLIRPFAALIPADEPTIGIGNVGTHNGFNIPFIGDIDEISLYSRALTASEVQAIYNNGINGNVQGGNGKFDPNQFLVSPRQSLAEAQLSINGSVVSNFFGRLGWVTKTISFTATQTSTALQIQGIEPGMLLDNISVVSVQTNYSYLVFTETTNLTTTPIKFAEPPFLPTASSTNIMASGFDSAAPNDYTNGMTFADGANVWGVVGNQVSVMNDPANADAGTSHFLTLAGGSITNVLPTVAGRSYVLTFRYRGPGIVGWWRGENNTNDSSGFGNNAVSAPNIAYQAGEVGQALGFSGLASVTIPAAASLAVSNLTFEGWIYPTTSTYEPIVDYGGPGQSSAAHLWINGAGLSSSPGVIYANMRPNANVGIQSAPGIVPQNAWSHVAFTYNLSTATEHLYYDGNQVAVNVSAPDIPPSAGEPVNLGWRNNAEALSGRRYTGLMDEISIYNRALSLSEINAIYQRGPLGKFDSGLPNPQSLAEAQVSVNGGAPATIIGDNTTWQTKSILFTATQNGTPLQITALEPGMLLDSFALGESAGEVDYLPEESLDLFDGMNAQGTWTLEIQDDRVGATNPPPLLLNWQLRFTYVTFGTNANGIPPGTTATNVIPPDAWQYFPVNVPTNADFATNLLVFATGPLDMWFNPTNNPVGTTPPDFELLAASTGGSYTLSLTNSPTNIIPGETYFIGLHNTNIFAVTNGFQVDFHLILPPTPLTNGVPITNTLPARLTLTGHSFGFYSVTVPTNADYATNTLIFATLPLNVWFNQTNVPVGTNPPDFLLITNSIGGSRVLTTTNVLGTNAIPPLIPGLTYYLGIQNTNGIPVTFGLVVNFHLLSTNLITGPGITVTNINGTNGFLVQWSGPTNYQYIIQWKTNLSPVFPWNTVSNPVINFTYIPPNGHYSWFDDGSLTGGWPPAKFYRVIANLLSEPVTNSTPTTNIVVAGSITPLTVLVPVNAIAATNVLVSASGPLNVYFNQTQTPTGNTSAGDVLMLSTTTSGTFVLTVPPLVPGANYYLGLQNPGTSNVSFVFEVNFELGAAPANPPSFSGISVTNINGTNAILLKWIAPTNYQFQIQWETNLAPAPAWHTISNVVLTWSGVVSPTNVAYGIFQFLDDGSLTGGLGPWKFYRLIEYPYSTPIPQTLTIINTAIVGNAVRFQWLAPTNYQYSVLWTTNLGMPLGSWSVLANPVLGLSNGVYTFTDTNQTGPLTNPKFFRILEH